MIKFDNISISYGKSCILKSFSAFIKSGEKTILDGPSGSGKSSVLKSAVGFVRPSEGRVEVDGTEVNDKNIPKIRKKVCYIPQKITFDSDETVFDFLSLPFSFKINSEIVPSREEMVRILSDFRLDADIMNKLMSELSGGQVQRTGIARGILLKRSIYLLDEITSNLDKKSMAAVFEVFDKMKDVTIVSVSHDADWVERFGRIIPLGESSPA
ncbi:MAG: ATP-binding cassette domain-containing protein [bacterium]